MDCIALEGLEFFSFHGFYPEENRIGNKYNIDIFAYTDVSWAAEHDAISGTLNYEEMYRIAKENTEKPVKLLEHIAYKIIKEMFVSFPELEKVQVNVCKFNPPIGGIAKWAKISMERTKPFQP